MIDAVPFDYASQHTPLIVVEARLGEQDHPARVVVDTGATANYPIFLSEAVAAKLGLRTSAPMVPATSTAVGPAIQSFRTAVLPVFSIGRQGIGRARVAVLTMIDDLSRRVGSPIDGIVGHEFLDGRVIAFDMVARTLDLEADPGAADRAIPFTMAPLKPLLMVEARINGAGPFLMEVDSGATGTSLSRAAAARAKVTVRGRGTLMGAGGTVSTGLGAAEVRIGGQSAKLGRVAITDTLDAIGKSAGVRVDGILGTDFLRGRVLTIDYPGKRMWIEPAPSSMARSAQAGGSAPTAER